MENFFIISPIISKFCENIFKNQNLKFCQIYDNYHKLFEKLNYQKKELFNTINLKTLIWVSIITVLDNF